MFKVKQNISNESEERKNKRWNHSFKKSEGGDHKTNLKAIIGKLKSKKIIVILYLATVSLLIIIPIIPILLAFLVGRWKSLTFKKS